MFADIAQSITIVFRIAAIVAFAPIPLLAQQAQDGERAPRRLATPSAEFPTPFTVIRAVMALPDGRVVLSDQEENKLLLLDFAKGTSKPLGRVGEGPKEYKSISGLYRAKGGGVFAFDQGQRRLLPISVQGDLLEVVDLPVPGRSSTGGYSRPERYIPDSLGNALGMADGFRAMANVDSAPLLRFRPGNKPDTLARVLKKKSKVLQTTANTIQTQDIIFSPQDVWVFAPDGALGVVRAAPYRVEWTPLTGPVVRGPVVNYSPIPVTKAERDALIAERNEKAGDAPSVSMGGRVGSPAAPVRPATSEPLFADVKAPFYGASISWPLLDEAGRLWVERYQPAGKKPHLYDVFDRRGALIDRVELPATSALIGFDKSWLYTVRTDDDGFQHCSDLRFRRFPEVFGHAGSSGVQPPRDDTTE